MKNKSFFRISIVLLLLISLLAGCAMKAEDSANSSAGYAPDSKKDFYETITDYDIVTEDSLESATSGSASDYQKKILTMEMNVETEDLDALLTNVEARVNALGGYVENKNVYRGSAYATRVYRNANLTLRIPADKASQFVDQVGEISNITSTSENVDDVTLQYVATESRILALETEQTRLLELLAKAENMEDLLMIESRLTEVRYELENVTSQLRVYDNLVNFATIHLYVNEVKEFTPTEEKTFWQRIGSGLSENLKDLAEGTENFVVFLITSLPYLILIAAVATVLILILKSCRKKRKARKNAAKAEPAE